MYGWSIDEVNLDCSLLEICLADIFSLVSPDFFLWWSYQPSFLKVIHSSNSLSILRLNHMYVRWSCQPSPLKVVQGFIVFFERMIPMNEWMNGGHTSSLLWERTKFIEGWTMNEWTKEWRNERITERMNKRANEWKNEYISSSFPHRMNDWMEWNECGEWNTCKMWNEKGQLQWQKSAILKTEE